MVLVHPSFLETKTPMAGIAMVWSYSHPRETSVSCLDMASPACSCERNFIKEELLKVISKAYCASTSCGGSCVFSYVCSQEDHHPDFFMTPLLTFMSCTW